LDPVLLDPVLSDPVLSDPVFRIDRMSEVVLAGDGPDGPQPWPYVPSLLDAELAPDDVAAWAATVTPGSAVVKPLVHLDPRALSDAGRVDALAALERQQSWIDAQQLRVLAVMAADPGVKSPTAVLDKDWVREDVACALRLSARTAADRLEFARQMSRLPATLALQERGEITVHHSRHLAETVMVLDDATAAAVEAAVLAKAPEQVLANFKRSVRKAVLTVAPIPAEERHEHAATRRRVARTPVADGMSEIWMLLPDPGAATVMTAIDALARHCAPDDPRTPDQRRADAVVQVALNTLHGSGDGDLPREHGLRPSVQVTVALSTLLGLDEQPGELAGSGPIPASVARRIAADPTGTWRRLVTDDRGHLLDYGRTTYRPPQDLTDHVIARDRTCRFPHCNRQARHCELDHETAWTDGGPTNESNIHALCTRHHRAKHEAGWQPQRQPDGDTPWTSPTRHTYLEPAATYPLDRTTRPSQPNEACQPNQPSPSNQPDEPSPSNQPDEPRPPNQPDEPRPPKKPSPPVSDPPPF
jgi:hypothetical protein